MEITMNKIETQSLNVPGMHDLKAQEMQDLKTQEGSVNKKQPVASESAPVNDQHSRIIAEKFQGFVDRMNINIAFSTYGEKNKIIITVSEKETGKLIREIPPEELQQLYVKMEEFIGMLFNQKV